MNLFGVLFLSSFLGQASALLAQQTAGLLEAPARREGRLHTCSPGSRAHRRWRRARAAGRRP